MRGLRVLNWTQQKRGDTNAISSPLAGPHESKNDAQNSKASCHRPLERLNPCFNAVKALPVGPNLVLERVEICLNLVNIRLVGFLV